MALNSSIEWTEATWNPVTGCSKVSAGCAHCYAERLAERLQAMGNPNYRNGFKVALHEHMLSLPGTWTQPRMIFVNSMSDLFHDEVPDDYIRRVFDEMVAAPWHTYQVLTKRSARLRELAPTLPWPDHIWMGVTVESGRYVDRVRDLATVPTAVRFLSCEPLISDIGHLPLDGIHWVIVGGESGPGARVMRKDWVLSIRQQCEVAGVLFYFKQWGGTRKHLNGRLLDGRTYDDIPEALRPPILIHYPAASDSCMAELPLVADATR